MSDDFSSDSLSVETEKPEHPSDGEFAAIYDQVRAIPPGQVMSYGDVGAAVGVSARHVGWALSFVPDGVPWQRVVGADGYLRIARRSPLLKARQKALLESEGVRFDDKERVERSFFSDASGDEPGQVSLGL